MGWLIYILTMTGVTAVVSFVMASLFRSTGLCILASAITAEALVVLYFLIQAVDSRHPEDVLLGVNITVMFFTPVFIISAVGFTLLARLAYRKLKWKHYGGSPIDGGNVLPR